MASVGHLDRKGLTTDLAVPEVPRRNSAQDVNQKFAVVGRREYTVLVAVACPVSVAEVDSPVFSTRIPAAGEGLVVECPY